MKPAILVCNLKETQTPFLDNEYGECSLCGAGIQFRPHAPKGVSRICVTCFGKIPKGEVEIAVTAQTLKELRRLTKN